MGEKMNLGRNSNDGNGGAEEEEEERRSGAEGRRWEEWTDRKWAKKINV